MGSRLEGGYACVGGSFPRDKLDGDMPRLFVGIGMPVEVSERLTALREPVEEVRWVGAEKMHLTLRFIGEVDEHRIESLAVGLDGIDVARFEMRVEGVGVFPSRRRPRVLWAGVAADEELWSLQTRVEETLRLLGVKAEENPFHPHVTLARLKRVDPHWARSFLHRHHRFIGGVFSVPSFHLYQSRLSKSGARYEKMATFSLSKG